MSNSGATLQERLRWHWNITIKHVRCQAPDCQHRARMLYGGAGRGRHWLCGDDGCKHWWFTLPGWPEP
jgi:hypothetical protein